MNTNIKANTPQSTAIQQSTASAAATTPSTIQTPPANTTRTSNSQAQIPQATISKIATTPSTSTVTSSNAPIRQYNTTTATNATSTIKQYTSTATPATATTTTVVKSTPTTTTYPPSESLKRTQPPTSDIDDKKVLKKKRLVGPLTIAEEDFIANAFKNVPDAKLSTDVKRIKRKFLLRELKRNLNLETFDIDLKIQHYASATKKKDQKLSIYFPKEDIPAVFTKKPLHQLENVVDDKINELTHPLQVFSTQQQLLLEKQQLEKQQQIEKQHQLELQKQIEKQQQLENFRKTVKDVVTAHEDGIHSILAHASFYFDAKPFKPIPPPPPPIKSNPNTQQSTIDPSSSTTTVSTATTTTDQNTQTDNDLKKHYHWSNVNNSQQQQQQQQQQQEQQNLNKPFQILSEKIICPKKDIDQIIQPFVSPHTTRELKAYIRRDYETVPKHVELLRELYQFFITNGMVEYSPLATEFYPIDYRYLTPELIDKTQWFLCEEFWPGIDLNEILEYPDYTVVAMYRNMVVGCGMMNPDGYIMFLSVRPGWQSSGIASFMLYHLTQTMIGRDITLHVSTNNTAIILYQKFGFKIEEHIIGFYDKFYSTESGRSKDAFFLRLRR